MTALSAATRVGYASDWALFTDWCTAADQPALPAVATTVVLFLTENPAAVATCARRVTAIAHLHRRYGYPSPTDQPEVKQWLRLAAGLPAERDPAAAPDTIEVLLRQIPTTGWPAGLFGRRDRMLLITRYTANLTRTQLIGLSTEHLSVDAERLTITSGTDTVTLSATVESSTCPGCAWILWRRMLHMLAHHSSARLLSDTLRRTVSLADGDGHRCATAKDRTFSRPMPIFLPLDRWGAAAVTPTSISTRSMSTLTSGHLTGWAPTHPDPYPPAEETALDEGIPASPAPAPTDPQAAAERYLQGLEQRRRDVADLADVRDILDDVDHAAADLNARIKELAERYGLIIPAATTDLPRPPGTPNRPSRSVPAPQRASGSGTR